MKSVRLTGRAHSVKKTAGVEPLSFALEEMGWLLSGLYRVFRDCTIIILPAYLDNKKQAENIEDLRGYKIFSLPVDFSCVRAWIVLVSAPFPALVKPVNA